MAETGLTRAALHRLTQPLVSSNRLLRIPEGVLLSDEAFASAAEGVLSRMKTETRSAGLSRSELKDQTGLSKEIFDFLLEKLVREQRLRLQDALVYASGADPQPPGPDLELLSAITAVYESAGLTAPSTSEVASALNLDDREMRRLMTSLLSDKILVKVGTDGPYIHQGALEALRVRVRELRGRHSTSHASNR